MRGRGVSTSSRLPTRAASPWRSTSSLHIACTAMSSDDLLKGKRGFVELKEAAEICNFTEPTFRDLIKRKPAGFPEPLRPGKKYYFRVAELELWILGSAAETRNQPQGRPPQITDAPLKRPRGRPRKGVELPRQQGGEQ